MVLANRRVLCGSICNVVLQDEELVDCWKDGHPCGEGSSSPGEEWQLRRFPPPPPPPPRCFLVRSSGIVLAWTSSQTHGDVKEAQSRTMLSSGNPAWYNKTSSLYGTVRNAACSPLSVPRDFVCSLPDGQRPPLWLWQVLCTSGVCVAISTRSRQL